MSGSFRAGEPDDDELVDDDIPETHRRISFVGVRSSQELIPTHLEKTFACRLRHAVDSMLYGPVHIRCAMSLLVACVLCLLCCRARQPQDGADWLDVAVSCVAVGLWLIFCVPMLLATVNVRLLSLVLQALFRVFFAEMAVMAYAYYRGHNNVLRRGFSLFPTLEANRPGIGLAWLGEAGYNLRLSSLLSCLLVACVVTVMEMWNT
ncbi:uncharacterized protein LOC143276204 [Babylonia areolata]|uniref:uncharacterized protein LOC143276204 n=1 Tax=Babylonia areolata TaxID=304850 RepID=UPI003FD479A3